MPINTKHEKYTRNEQSWETTRAVIEGERAIRDDITRWLPPPPGLKITSNINLNDILRGGFTTNHNRYTFYASFAEWTDITSIAMNGIQGLVHEKPPQIEVPADMEYLIESATPNGDSLVELWETVTREIFAAGRITLLSEIFEDDLYLCPYIAESLINWIVLPKLAGGGPVMVVLEENHRRPMEDDRYQQENITQYRELELEPELGVYRVRLWEAKEGEDPKIVYLEDGDEEGWITPVLFGKGFEEIPITVINAVEKGFKYGPIPALPMCRRALNIFRKTADYHRALYIKGDPQCYLAGVDEDEVPDMIGGGEIWAFQNPEASAQYLDIEGSGIPYMRDSINDQYDRFAQEVGQLTEEPDGGGPESGESRKARHNRADVTIKSIIVNAAAAIEGHLRQIARLKGKSDAEVEKIIFAANTDFAEPLMSGKALMDYILYKNAGGPISQRTIHEISRRHRVTEFDFEEELKEIETEEALIEPAIPPGESDDMEDEEEQDDEEKNGPVDQETDEDDDKEE